MNLTRDMYVPAIRWRQGEYQALFRLAPSAKDRVVPYVTVPEIEFDFEEWRPKKTVQEHVHPFAARFKAKWGQRPAWIAVHPSIADQSMDDGRDILTYVFDALRAFRAMAVPAIPLDANPATVARVRAIARSDGQGVAISVRLEDLMKPSPRVRLEVLAAALNVGLDEVDLIVDLGAPNFEPYDAFAGALIAAMGRLGDLDSFRNFVLVGTAIPETFKDVAKGADQLTRHDWLFYCSLIGKISTRDAPTQLRRLYDRPSRVHADRHAQDQIGWQAHLHDDGGVGDTQGGRLPRPPRTNVRALRVHCRVREVQRVGLFERRRLHRKVRSSNGKAEQPAVVEICDDQSSHHVCSGRSRQAWRRTITARIEAVTSRKVKASQSIS